MTLLHACLYCHVERFQNLRDLYWHYNTCQNSPYRGGISIPTREHDPQASVLEPTLGSLTPSSSSSPSVQPNPFTPTSPASLHHHDHPTTFAQHAAPTFTPTDSFASSLPSTPASTLQPQISPSSRPQPPPPSIVLLPPPSPPAPSSRPSSRATRGRLTASSSTRGTASELAGNRLMRRNFTATIPIPSSSSSSTPSPSLSTSVPPPPPFSHLVPAFRPYSNPHTPHAQVSAPFHSHTQSFGLDPNTNTNLISTLNPSLGTGTAGPSPSSFSNPNAFARPRPRGNFVHSYSHSHLDFRGATVSRGVSPLRGDWGQPVQTYAPNRSLGFGNGQRGQESTGEAREQDRGGLTPLASSTSTIVGGSLPAYFDGAFSNAGPSDASLDSARSEQGIGVGSYSRSSSATPAPPSPASTTYTYGSYSDFDSPMSAPASSYSTSQESFSPWSGTPTTASMSSSGPAWQPQATTEPELSYQSNSYQQQFPHSQHPSHQHPHPQSQTQQQPSRTVPHPLAGAGESGGMYVGTSVGSNKPIDIPPSLEHMQFSYHGSDILAAGSASGAGLNASGPARPYHPPPTRSYSYPIQSSSNANLLAGPGSGSVPRYGPPTQAPPSASTSSASTQEPMTGWNPAPNPPPSALDYGFSLFNVELSGAASRREERREAQGRRGSSETIVGEQGSRASSGVRNRERQ